MILLSGLGQKVNSMKKFSTLLVFLLYALSFLNAQKKQMTPAVFEEWRDIKSEKISNDGNWVTYVNHHEKKDPILELYDHSSNRTFIFSRADKAKFSADNKFLIFKIHPAVDTIKQLKREKVKKEDLPGDTLCILRLADQFQTKIPRVTEYSLPDYWSGQVFMTQDPETQEEKDSTSIASSTLLIWHLENNETDSISFIDKYKIAERQPGIVLSRLKQDSLNLPAGQSVEKGVFYFDLKNRVLITIIQEKAKYKQLAISPNANRVAFLQDKDTSKIFHRPYQLFSWTTRSKSAVKLCNNYPEFAGNKYRLTKNSNLRFSRSGDRLFFGVAVPAIEPDTTILEEDKADVEIWTSLDESIYPQQNVNVKSEQKKTLGCIYDFSKNKFIQVGQENFDRIRYQKDRDHKYAIAYDESPGHRAMSWEGFPIRKDIYAIDLSTGQKTKFIENLATNPRLSPQAKFAFFYNRMENAWYSYDLSKSKLIKMAGPETTTFDNELHDLPIDHFDYGFAGWTAEDKYFLVYDRYDIWKLDPLGKTKPQNLTSGRKDKKIHRLIRLDRENNFYKNDEPWLLHVQNEVDRSEGYCSFDLKNNKIIPLIEGRTAYQRNPKKARDANRIIYYFQSFQIYPDLHIADNFDFSNAKRISDINPQQSEYAWGSIEKFSWTDYEGNLVNGMICKPPNFDPAKKYPLLVNFYERSSQRIHRYPKIFPHRSTINYAYYANRGYVIFNPDISYLVGQPGESAYRAVMSGVDALLELGYVDQDNMGLQGHSWGGYQIAYLLTRTNRFKCAESGAPVVNMTSAYGGVRWGSGLSRMFQYEKTQSRLGATLWENPKRYLDNSPLFELDKMETPVLILHNDNDGAVPWYQGIEYFLALRRLDKPAWLLNYPGEPHWPLKRPNREDFQLRMSQFFDHYLQGAAIPRWMVEGVPAINKGLDDALELSEK